MWYVCLVKCMFSPTSYLEYLWFYLGVSKVLLVLSLHNTRYSCQWNWQWCCLLWLIGDLTLYNWWCSSNALGLYLSLRVRIQFLLKKINFANVFFQLINYSLMHINTPTALKELSEYCMHYVAVPSIWLRNYIDYLSMLLCCISQLYTCRHKQPLLDWIFQRNTSSLWVTQFKGGKTD